MRYFLVFVLFFLTFSTQLNGQGVYAPLDREYSHLLQRYEILSGQLFHDVHSSFQPYTRRNIVNSVISDSIFTSKADKFNRQYLLNDSHEWTESEENSKKPVLKYFYRKKADAYYLTDSNAFEIHANPILHLYGGMDSEKDEPLFINTRGVTIRGMIDKKVGFTSTLTENQMRVPDYVDERISEDGVIPGEGFWKRFGSNGYDFFNATGYFTFNATKHIALQFGHDRNFVGNGYRSMVLSDFSSPYLFLKVETQVWKFKYTNLFAQLMAQRSPVPYPRKYLAFHHLSVNIGKKLNIGVFESVIAGRPDDNSLDLAYLNPIIFYRSIEQNLGSPDNALLGMDFKYLPFKKISLYGQVVFDEVVISNLREGNGWWANKFGIQAGMKYVDAFGVKNLDFQLEGNLARPYTYAHFTDYTNYQNFQQPLAHPMGANFFEGIFIARYQPLPKLTINVKQILIDRGRDFYYRDTVLNYGQNIRLDYSTYVNEFGNKIGQGFAQNISISQIGMTYMLRHNVFIDLYYTRRWNRFQPNRVNTRFAQTGPVDPNNSGNQTVDSHILGLGLRWNAFLRQFDF
jgi:hypothetical protein